MPPPTPNQEATVIDIQGKRKISFLQWGLTGFVNYTSGMPGAQEWLANTKQAQ